MALDAYAANAFWNLESGLLLWLKLAEERGLGRVDFENVTAKFTRLA